MAARAALLTEDGNLLLKRGKIDETIVTQMMGRQHTGFGVNLAVRLGPDDAAGVARIPRIICVTDEGKVLQL